MARSRSGGFAAQSRVTRLVLMFVFVLVAAQWSARPESWHWLLPPEPIEQAPAEEIANPEPANELPAGVFYANAMAQGSDVEADSDQEAVNESDEAPTHDAASPEEPDEERQKEPGDDANPRAVPFAELDLSVINDETVGVRSSEQQAYYGFLSHLRDESQEKLLAESRTDVSFPNLISEPARFRGEAIAFRGEAKRVVRLPAIDNAYDIGEAYEVWVRTADSGQDLYRVVCLELPEELEVAEETNSPVIVAGRFFKRQGYMSVNGTRFTPLILAKTITFVPDAEGINQNLTRYIIYFAVAVICATFALVTYLRLTDRRGKAVVQRHAKSMPDEDLSETFNELSEEA